MKGELRKENPLLDKSYVFALRILEVTDSMIEKREYTISRQLARSGTAIGALSREAQRAESPKDFIHKLHIALKEADESLYWLELARDRRHIDKDTAHELHANCNELIKLLFSIIKTSKSKLPQKRTIHN